MSRKGTNILITFLCLLIAILIGLGIFMTWLTYEQTNALQSRLDQLIETESQEEIITAETENGITLAPVYGDSDYEEPEHSFVFVGDSRTVGMEEAVQKAYSDDTCTFIGKVGEGLYWLRNDGIDQLKAVLEDTPDAEVVLNLGVNDLEECSNYTKYYEKLFSDYPDASFYILSVNPVGEKLEGTDNEEIEEFNNSMMTTFPDQYLDCYSYLLQEGFDTVDELHYTDDTYRLIHHFVIEKLAQ